MNGAVWIFIYISIRRLGYIQIIVLDDFSLNDKSTIIQKMILENTLKLSVIELVILTNTPKSTVIEQNLSWRFYSVLNVFKVLKRDFTCHFKCF